MKFLSILKFAVILNYLNFRIFENFWNFLIFYLCLTQVTYLHPEDCDTRKRSDSRTKRRERLYIKSGSSCVDRLNVKRAGWYLRSTSLHELSISCRETITQSCCLLLVNRYRRSMRGRYYTSYGNVPEIRDSISTHFSYVLLHYPTSSPIYNILIQRISILINLIKPEVINFRIFKLILYSYLKHRQRYKNWPLSVKDDRRIFTFDYEIYRPSVKMQGQNFC